MLAIRCHAQFTSSGLCNVFDNRPDEPVVLEYIIEDATPTSDYICANVSLGCPAPGQYISTPHTWYSDRDCSPCADGTVQAGTSGDSCSPWRVCVPAGYQIVPPTLSSDRVCAPINLCDPATEFVVQDATPTSDFICANVTLGCPAPGQYISVPSTGYTDRGCSPCADGTFQPGTSGDPCDPWRVCAPAGYQIVPPTLSSDRVCAPTHPCDPATEFVVREATPTSDFQCQFRTLDCPDPGQYISVPSTLSTDRICAPCPDGTFQPSRSGQACRAWRVCTVYDGGTGWNQEFRTADPTPTSDRGCRRATRCSSLEYLLTAATATTDNTCANITLGCPVAGQYISTQATAVADRVCSSCPSGTYQDSTSGAACRGHSSCTAQQFEVTAPTPTSNRQCRRIATCSRTQYVSTPATPTTDASCSRISSGCPATGQYIVEQATLTSDRVCTPCSYGSYQASQNGQPCTTWDVCVTSGAAQEYRTADPTPTSDRTCVPVNRCDTATEYIIAAATDTRDFICQDVTSGCPAAGMYISVPRSPTTDRICSSCPVDTFQPTGSGEPCTIHTVCDPVGPTEQHEVAAPTVTTDRQCRQTTQCAIGLTEYIAINATWTSDRGCAAISIGCPEAGMFISDQASTYFDRVCDDCPLEFFAPNASGFACTSHRGPCDAHHEYETQRGTGTSDRTCADLTVCERLSYAETPRTPTSDRVCAPHSIGCPEAGMYAATPPTLIADRTCLSCPAHTYNPSRLFVDFCEQHTACLFPEAFQTMTPTITTDRTCAAITSCSNTEYQTGAPDATTDRVCSDVVCGPGEEVKLTSSGFAFCSVCQQGTFSSAESVYNEDCATHTECIEGSTFETVTPTVSTDRVCVETAVCTNNEVVDSWATVDVDRVCEAVPQFWRTLLIIAIATGVMLLCCCFICVVYVRRRGRRSTFELVEDARYSEDEVTKMIDDAVTAFEIHNALTLGTAKAEDVMATSRGIEGWALLRGRPIGTDFKIANQPAEDELIPWTRAYDARDGDGDDTIINPAFAVPVELGGFAAADVPRVPFPLPDGTNWADPSCRLVRLKGADIIDSGLTIAANTDGLGACVINADAGRSGSLAGLRRGDVVVVVDGDEAAARQSGTVAHIQRLLHTNGAFFELKVLATALPETDVPSMAINTTGDGNSRGSDATDDGVTDGSVRVTVRRGATGFGLTFGGPKDDARAKLKGYGMYIKSVGAGSPASSMPEVTTKVGWQVIRINGQDATRATRGVMVRLVSTANDTLELELRRNDVLWGSYEQKEPAAAKEARAMPSPVPDPTVGPAPASGSDALPDPADKKAARAARAAAKAKKNREEIEAAMQKVTEG